MRKSSAKTIKTTGILKITIKTTFYKTFATNVSASGSNFNWCILTVLWGLVAVRRVVVMEVMVVVVGVKRVV